MLAQQWTDGLVRTAEAAWRWIVDHLPDLVAALALVAGGLLVAWLLRGLTRRALGRMPRWLAGRGLGAEADTSGAARILTNVAATTVFWIVVVFFLAAAGETLGLGVVHDGLALLARYLPTVAAAAVVLVVGVLLGNGARAAATAAATSAKLVHAGVLGQAVRAVVVVLAVVIALDQLGIESTVLVSVVSVVAGALVGGAALAFGLGARGEVGNILAVHHVSRIYRVGQRVRVGAVEGTVTEFTSTAVVLETAEGRAVVPAKTFSEEISVLLEETPR